MGEKGPAGAKGGAESEGKGGPLTTADQAIDGLQDPTKRFSAHICQRWPLPHSTLISSAYFLEPC